MKKIILIQLLILYLGGFLFSGNILNEDFYMEYIVKINGNSKGALVIHSQKDIAEVEYININKNDKLPFFYGYKMFKFEKKNNMLRSTNIKLKKSKNGTLDNNYEIMYSVNTDEADEYNIAKADIRTMAAIKDIKAEEVVNTFKAKPLNSLEGLLLYFMNTNNIKSTDRIWLYEPQKNILFHLGMIEKKPQSSNININGNAFRTKKYIIGRISFDGSKKIPLFEIHTYKKLVLSLKAISGKFELELNGIGRNYIKARESATKMVAKKTDDDLSRMHKMLEIVSVGKYDEGIFEVKSSIKFNELKIRGQEKENLFNYLAEANSDDLRGGGGLEFKSVNEKEICAYIQSVYPNGYSKDCRFDKIPEEKFLSIDTINNILDKESYKYTECKISSGINLLGGGKKFSCKTTKSKMKEIKYIPNIGKVLFKYYHSNNHKSELHYKDSDKVTDRNGKFWIKLEMYRYHKNEYYRLMNEHASNTLKKKYFTHANNRNSRNNINFVKKGDKYGFGVNKEKFSLYICNKNHNLRNNFSKYDKKRGCYMSYSQNISEATQEGYIDKKIDDIKPIIKLSGRKTSKNNGNVYFKELKGKPRNKFNLN